MSRCLTSPAEMLPTSMCIGTMPVASNCSTLPTLRHLFPCMCGLQPRVGAASFLVTILKDPFQLLPDACPEIPRCRWLKKLWWVQGGELNVLLQLPWVDPDVIKKVSRKGGARSVAELMGMGEQERLELLVTSGAPLSPEKSHHCAFS